MTSKEIFAIDLFSGAGGLSLGLEQAGIKVSLANELETDFARTHELNHPTTVMINRDIALVDFRQELKHLEFDQHGKLKLLCGGPPCQGFSTVGKKHFSDPRNSLFGQFLRVADEIEPDYILFENVSGFKKLYGGQVYEILLEQLGKRGFDTVHSVLNAKDYGLPQSRDRTIVLGWQRGLKPVQMPPISHAQADLLQQHCNYLTIMDAISDLPPIGPNEEASHYLTEPLNYYQSAMRMGAKRLTEHNASNYGEKMREILSLVPRGGTVMDLPAHLRPRSYFKNTYARLLPEQPSPTITRNFGTPSSSRCIHPFQNRALSTREGARLQGFPDTYRFYGSKISKNLQIGNAVPPLFGKILGIQIIKAVQEK